MRFRQLLAVRVLKINLFLFFCVRVYSLCSINEVVLVGDMYVWACESTATLYSDVYMHYEPTFYLFINTPCKARM